MPACRIFARDSRWTIVWIDDGETVVKHRVTFFRAKLLARRLGFTHAHVNHSLRRTAIT